MTDMRWRAKNVGTIEGFLSSSECDEYIRFGEKIGFAEAPVSTPAGMIMMKDVRNNERVMVDDAARARLLYDRLSVHLALRFQKKWTPFAVNERLRLYRYDVGQQFDWHLDGYFEREPGERSHFTFMVYLNDDFEGGATSFRDGYGGASVGDPFRIVPKMGMALLFHHPIMHRGDPVTRGRKYVLRTDVMYRRTLEAVRA
ncbi:2OG-Fe(II) oxygenase family protein [Bradyrhizobium sp. HKCCYLRH2015]|uniref:2OG-Fe(II) oxygenase family protein n=1 Tax=Bradyrhizobium sp. HKCCYLRH2015 TaxID=3420742 RepID=UPI003EBD7A7F